MKTEIPPFRWKLWLTLAGASAVVLLPARAQTDPVALAPVVTTATRLPDSILTVGSDVAAITGEELTRAQQFTLADALGTVSSAPIFATGQAGAAASVFLRGANSNQTLFLVDGIRMSDANTDYGVFLGGARFFPSDRLEIAQGPQSTLYGSEAVGGVVALSAQPGTGPATAALSAEAGSFSSVSGLLTAQAGATAQAPWAYNVSVAAGHTANQRINNTFDSEDVALRLDRRFSSGLALGATLRGFVARYGDPSDIFTNDTRAYEKENNWLGTVFAEARPASDWTTHLTLGGQDRRFLSVEPSFSEITLTRNRRGVADWQNVVQAGAANRIVAGLTAESASTSNDGYGHIDRHQSLLAFYAEDEWCLPDSLTLTAGLRHDDFDTFGSATTGRLTAAWLVANRAVKLRGSYGTGFDAPSFLELYGRDFGYLGNPALSPERSRGWDGGLDLYPPGLPATFGLTWFQNDFRDLIEYDFSRYPAPGTTKNIERARTRGLELTLKTKLIGPVQFRAAYTRLQAEDLTATTPLLRRPHYNANAELWSDLGHGVSAGAGAAWVGTRADADAATFATVNDPSYAVARLFAAWQVTPHLSLEARLENALDRAYAPVNGYPALGRGFFGGMKWKF